MEMIVGMFVGGGGLTRKAALHIMESNSGEDTLPGYYVGVCFTFLVY